MWACQRNNLELVKVLTTTFNVSPFDISHDDFDAESPLFRAISAPSYEVLEFLLTLPLPDGIESIYDHKKNNPLHETWRKGDPKVIKMVEEKSKLDARYGTMQKVNRYGEKPLDVPHN